MTKTDSDASPQGLATFRLTTTRRYSTLPLLVVPTLRNGETMSNGTHCFRSLRVVLVTAGILAPMLAVTAQSFQKPVVTHKTVSEYPGPPSSLAGMIGASDAVVRGRVAGRAPFPKGEKPQPVQSLYRVQVIEVMQGSDAGPAPGEAIEVVRIGGVIEHPNRVDHVVDEGFPDFENGQEYVLFLNRSRSGTFWVPAFGPDSVFALRDSSVEPFGKASVSRAQAGPEASFLEAVRGFGQSKRLRQ